MCLVVLGGTPLLGLVDTGSAVTLVHCRVLEKAKIDFKLGMVREPVVSANGQPLDIKGKCELEIFTRSQALAVGTSHKMRFFFVLCFLR